MLVIASLEGDAESVIEEKLFQIPDGDGEKSAVEAGEWMIGLADGLIKAATS
jgi:hypothetical protein